VNRHDVHKQLEHHLPFDPVEAGHHAKTLALVGRYPDNFWRRTNLVGHMTASAFVVNKEHSHALMLHHAALQKWLQPGGHIDDSDASPLAAAIRETIEETGIAAHPAPYLRLGGVNVKDAPLTDVALYDVDVHAIPARKKNGVEEPAHHHYDLRYLLVAASAEVESGIARMARKLMNG
jgi:8-oxo-dGTP pyrophosphatase MutT (NUDIX family)